MTLNFGHKLLIAFLVFGGIMFYLVYSSLKTDFELVSPNYYQDELAYQQVIDAARNANELNTKATLLQNEKEIVLQLPAEMKNQPVNGSVYFYCPANSRKDRTITLKPDANGEQVFIVGKDMLPASYQVKINWKLNAKAYFQDSYLEVK